MALVRSREIKTLRTFKGWKKDVILTPLFLLHSNCYSNVNCRLKTAFQSLAVTSTASSKEGVDGVSAGPQS